MARSESLFVVARRQFIRGFKVEALKLVKERIESITQAARDLDIHQTMLRTWIPEVAADPQQAFPGKGMMKPE
ncbi:transposase [Roseateles sp. PN1]|uniref:transposase n=1 Tax=Roseateles sp. PN1 TaxID=3137372 RepID=UPI003138E381